MAACPRNQLLHLKNSLSQLLTFFQGHGSLCEAVFEVTRWPDGKVTCPACGSGRVFPTSLGWKCKEKKCRRHFSVTVGTVLHNSKVPLYKWLSAILLIADDEAVNQSTLSELLPVTPKTSRMMAVLIRKVLPGAGTQVEFWPLQRASHNSMADPRSRLLRSRFLKFSRRLHRWAGPTLARKVFNVLVCLAQFPALTHAKLHETGHSEFHRDLRDLGVSKTRTGSTRTHRYSVTIDPVTEDTIQHLGEVWVCDRETTVRRLVNSIVDVDVLVNDVIKFTREVWPKILFDVSKKKTLRYNSSEKVNNALTRLAIQALGAGNRSNIFRILVIFVAEKEKVIYLSRAQLSTVRLRDEIDDVNRTPAVRQRSLKATRRIMFPVP